MSFQDHFSAGATGYVAHRPHYPAALFDWLGDIAPARGLAWDCACGSGQATQGLARVFDRVVATDASAQQIAAAPPRPNVVYQISRAEEPGFPEASVDCIAVAQAIHWFDFAAFYAQARRVARPDAVLAVWSYDSFQLDDRELNEIADAFYEPVLGPFWQPERLYLKEAYRTLPFPFAEELRAPPFAIEMDWNLAELTGYFRTWSATRNFIAAHRHDPVALVEMKLRDAWGDPSRRVKVTMPLGMRVARL